MINNLKKLTSLNSKEAKELFNKCFKLITNDKTCVHALAMNNDGWEEKFGPLQNIPFSLKDNFCTKKHKTTAGTKILADFNPTYNATVYEILIKSGAQMICKDNMDELGMGGTGIQSGFGNVINPINDKYISGGSSSGSAYHVAKGYVSFAIGTDTGDSIRLPAAYCGIIGFKPSWGSISRWGVVPYACSLDTVGILANKIDIINHVFAVLTEKVDPKDTTMTLPNPRNELFKFENLKFLTFKNINLKIQSSSYKIEFNKVIKFLEKHNLVEMLNIDSWILESTYPTYKIISNVETLSCHSNLTGIQFGPNVADYDNWEDLTFKNRTNCLLIETKKRLFYGLYSIQHENSLIYKKAFAIRIRIENIMKEYFAKYDAIILPIMGEKPPLLNNVLKDSNPLFNILNDHLLFANFYGSPSISIPIGHIDEMPISISITCDKGEDWKCLQIANEIIQHINYKNKLIQDEYE